jgi:hypothetical protein
MDRATLAALLAPMQARIDFEDSDAGVRVWAGFSLPGADEIGPFAVPDAVHEAFVESDYDACVILEARGPAGVQRWSTTDSEDTGPYLDSACATLLCVDTDRERAAARVWSVAAQLRVGVCDGASVTMTWRGETSYAGARTVALLPSLEDGPLIVPDGLPRHVLERTLDAPRPVPTNAGLLGGFAGSRPSVAPPSALDERIRSEGLQLATPWAWHPAASRYAAIVRERRHRARPRRDTLAIFDEGDRERREVVLPGLDTGALAVLPDGCVLCVAGEGFVWLLGRNGQTLLEIRSAPAGGDWSVDAPRLTVDHEGVRLWADEGESLLLPAT